MILLIDNKPAAIKEGSSFEYHSDNRLFQDRDDYSLNIELPLDCAENHAIFGNIHRKDVDIENIFFDAEIIAGNFHKSGAVAVTGITETMVKVQFLEKRSYQNFYPDFDERYIDELDLGTMPHWIPNNRGSGGSGGRPRPGYDDDDQNYQSKTPAQAWGDGDVIALPWVNNSSGNMQNRADYDHLNDEYVWHVVKDDDDDTEVVKGLSVQPRLYYLVQLICEALEYDLVAEAWEESEYYHLYSFNSIPYAWGVGSWEQTLPHWTINEFFEQLERLMLCEFDIDHKRKIITFSWSNDNVIAAGTVELTDIVDEFALTVSRDDDSKYKGVRNIGYADPGHEMWNLYSCYWYFHEMNIINEVHPKVHIYPTLQALMAYLSDVSHEVFDTQHTTGRRRAWKHQGLYFAADIDTYFVLYGMGRVKSGQYHAISGEEVKMPVFRLIPLNAFGDRIFDVDNWEDKEEIGIVPVWIEDTFVEDDVLFFGDVVYAEVNDTDNTADSDNEYGKRQRTGLMSTEYPLQSSMVQHIKDGESGGNGDVFSNIQVGFWFGGWNSFKPYLPRPFIDDFVIKSSWSVDHQEHWVDHQWTKIDSGHNASLRINDDQYGQGMVLTDTIAIEPHRKYEFSFLSDTMPDVRAVFTIRGKKYLCAQIKTDISEDGMSQLKKGTFFRILE